MRSLVSCVEFEVRAQSILDIAFNKLFARTKGIGLKNAAATAAAYASGICNAKKYHNMHCSQFSIIMPRSDKAVLRGVSLLGRKQSLEYSEKL
jgi:hypothetical protein